MTATETLMEQIKKEAREAREAKQLKALGTIIGRSRVLTKDDATVLKGIVDSLVAITDKPVYQGFTYSTNVETIVAVASTLQYMKGDLREQVNEALWIVFDPDTRTAILDAYGRTPYYQEPVMIELNGSMVEIDPEAPARAKKGIKANVEDLEALVNSVALDLDLLGDYECKQSQADSAWASALSKVAKDEAMNAYKDEVED